MNLFSAEAQDSLAGWICVGRTAPKKRRRQICFVQCLSSKGMYPMSMGGEVDIWTLGSVVVEVEVEVTGSWVWVVAVVVVSEGSWPRTHW